MASPIRFDQEALRAGLNMPRDAYRGVGTKENGDCVCLMCGSTWTPTRKRLWWPIVSVRLADHWSFGTHGIEVDGEAIERRRYQTIVRLGPIRIILGRERAS